MDSVATISVSRKAMSALRISIGIIYIWFGALKFFHGLSPAEDLAIETINKLTFHFVPQPVNIILLAIWECTVGVLLVTDKWVRIAIALLLLHMICTFTPLVFFPELSFNHAPYAFSLVGQYIMKNIIIVCAAVVIWPPGKGVKVRR